MERDELSIGELSDFEENDMDGRDDVLVPHTIECAESDLSESHIEDHIINDLRDLNYRSSDTGSLSDSSDISDEEYQEIIRQQRAYDRRKKSNLGSMVGKRTMSERSDSDDDYFQRKLHPDQVGSSARRLKRRIGIRQNLMFQDPPLRPNDMDEPPEELEDTEMLGKELPFYAFTDMEVDSPWTSTLDVSRIAPSSHQNIEGNERASKEKESFPVSSSFGMEPEISPKSGENADVVDVDEGVRSDHDSCADETISVQSYADSLFDAGSVGSSASSVYSDTQALVGEYVDFLARDPGLEKLFMRSMLPTVLGPERFRRNYSRILQSYARDLKRQLSIWNEPKMPLRTQGLAFISRKSITMKTASIIASRHMEKAPRSPFRPGRTEGRNAEILGGDETSSGEESPENESAHIFVISELGQYFREGAPFQRMKRNLRNLVTPSTLLSRVKASTESMLDLVLGDDYLRFLVFKALSDPLVPVRGGQFDPEIEIRYFGSRLRAEANSPDHLRMAEFIETYAGYIGTRAAQRMEGMNMEAILQDPWLAREFAIDVAVVASATTEIKEKGRGHGVPDIVEMWTTSGSEAQSKSSGTSSVVGSSSLRSGTAATSPSSSVISFGTPPKAFVFLVVKASRYILAPIDVTEKKARDFFQAIVENYNMRRGWRRLLSIYVYSHCDFVKIKRYAPQSFDPGVRFSFPPHDESPHDKEYGYYPRPMPHAPVSRHMFNHLFNACYSDEGLAHKLHYAFISPSCVIKTIPGKLLDGMPKRDRLVDEEAEFGEDQDVEVFWGLVAREQRSALRVVVYMLLGLGPSLWFMFQWMFGWGHDGDLQDATVPLMFSATMLGILWAVVYSGDDVREVEQPR
ncbi:hypothetical protein SLS64_010973 [Diaporthe eres]